MPISRKKACAQCRQAKAGCSLALPRCGRCVERNLACDYHGRPSPYTPNSSTSSRLRNSQQASFSPSEEFNRAEDAPNLDLSILTAQETVDKELSQREATEFNYPFNFDPMFTLPTSLDMLSSFDGEMLPGSSPPLSDILSVAQPSTVATSSSARRRRKQRTPQAIFTTKMLLGQLESYPKMMIEGKTLPPFIHSQCALSDGLANPCLEAQNHQCLPEPLAICASLVQMFYSKTQGNRNFLWKTIYNEQARLKQDMRDQNHESALLATQAMCIYLLLQALDTESLDSNDITSMLASLAEFVVPWYSDSSYEIDLEDVSSPQSRRLWVFKESVRRTLCILYVIEAVLDVVIGNRETVHCRGSGSLPLPCVRGLWEVNSTYEWAQRYREIVKRKKSARALAIKDLVSLAQLSSIEEMPHEENNDVSDWCEKVDHFGIVIWTAATMQAANGLT